LFVAAVDVRWLAASNMLQKDAMLPRGHEATCGGMKILGGIIYKSGIGSRI